MRNAFSFVEVLVSIAILSFMGLALIKFNAFNKRAMERTLLKQENILLSSAMLFEKKTDDKKELELLELVDFAKLHDDDRKFLRSIELHATKTLDNELILGSTGEEELSIEYGTLAVTYKDYTQNYLWAQKEK